MKRTQPTRRPRGRPRTTSPRLSFYCRLAGQTKAGVYADVRPGETVGRVIDRWFRERERGPAKE